MQKKINDLSESTTTNISSSIPTFVDNNNSSDETIVTPTPKVNLARALELADSWGK